MKIVLVILIHTYSSSFLGVSGFRKSVNGKKPLPNARYISRKLIKSSNSTTRKYNALFAFFGQVVAYDIALFPVTFGETHLNYLYLHYHNFLILFHESFTWRISFAILFFVKSLTMYSLHKNPLVI